MTINEVYDLLTMSQENFIKLCKITYFQASGAGGQKRNRKLSAVRLTHMKSGTAVTSSESREPARNLQTAIQKLHLELVLDLDLKQVNETETDIALPLFRANANEHHPDFPGSVLAALPLFYLDKGSVGQTSEKLGTSSAALIRFFKKDKTLWRKVQQIRQEFGHYPLK